VGRVSDGHDKIYGSNRRYVLAELEERYVIWDLWDPGEEPSESFPLTEEGFDRANRRFTMLVRIDRGTRFPLLSGLRWTVLVGAAVWAAANAIYYLFLDQAEFEQSGFVDGVAKAGAIANHVWIGALAILGAMWLERRLREPSGVAPPRFDTTEQG
jgi:hypothetical protein